MAKGFRDVPLKDKPEAMVAVKEPVQEPEYTLQVQTDFYGAVDVFHLNKKDPKYQYRFLRNEATNLSTKTGEILVLKGGWQICPRSHCLKIGIPEKMLDPNGQYRVMENVLAFMPKELYEKKEAYKREKANKPVKQIERFLKEGDKSPELSSKIHETMKGIQPREKLGGNFAE